MPHVMRSNMWQNAEHQQHIVNSSWHTCSLHAKGGFNMVGAYPRGCNWDMNYGKGHEEKEKAEANIKKVAPLATDPVYGDKGPIYDHWLQ